MSPSVVASSTSTAPPTVAVVLYQFPVTKLRSWRTGYVRILTLYHDHFATYDPTTTTTTTTAGSSTSSSSSHTITSNATVNNKNTNKNTNSIISPSPSAVDDSKSSSSIITMKETNSWSYSQLIEYMAVPNESDTILLQVQNQKDGGSNTTTSTNHTTVDKLKFSCGNYPTTTSITLTGNSHPPSNTTTTSHPNTSVIIPIRSMVLTMLLRQQHVSGQTPKNINRYPMFSNVTKSYLTTTTSEARRSTQLVTLQLVPYGIIEYTATNTNNTHSGMAHPETYLYIDMVAISFPSPRTTNDLLLHFRETNRVLCYTIPESNGRTTFFTTVQEHCVNLGIYHVPFPHHNTTAITATTVSQQQQQQQYGLPMIPSMTMETWISQQMNFNVGPTILSWMVTPVVTTTTTNNTNSTTSIPQPRQLTVTGYGYIIETELSQHHSRPSRIRRLCDIYCLIRDRTNTSRFTIEYNDCTTIVSYTIVRSSASSTSTSTTLHIRDAVLVSIYDAAHYHHNTIIHISDVPSSFRYCLTLPPHPSCYSSSSDMSVAGSEALGFIPPSPTGKVAAMTNLFQSTPVPQYTLKRLYSIATYIYSLISGDFALPQQSVAHQQEHEQYIRNLYQQIECSRTLVDACCEFNCSVQLPHVDFMNPNSTTEKHIIGTMGSLLGIIAKLLQYKNATTIPSPTTTTNTTDATTTILRQPPATPLPDVQRRMRSEQMAGTMFQTLYRLAQTTTGYKSSAELTTLRECLPYLWALEDTYCRYSAYSVLNVLLSGTTRAIIKNPPPQRDMETEYVNKNVILKCGRTSMIDGLVASLLPAGDDPAQHPPQDSVPSDLILMVTSDILQGLLCSYHDTTSPEHFQLFIGALAHRYRALLSLLRSSTPFVLENTALLLHLLSTHAPSSTTAIRDAVLSSAIVLQHFYTATFSPLEGQRFLSRYLCSLWLSGPPNCDEKRLLKRVVPHGFLAFLNMPPLSRMEEDQLDVLERDIIEGNVTDQGAAAAAAAALASSNNLDTAMMGHSTHDPAIVAAAGGTNTARLRARMTLASNTSIHMGQPIPKENFRIFFHVLTQDHNMADLIWNQQTRRELRIALESELEYIRRETEARGINAIAWNHQQFHVKYPSLDNEVKVGDVYMRLWLQAGDGFIRSWDEPVRLFEHLFRRFLCEVDRNEKVTVMCIRCLERLYAIHALAIGPFTDVSIIIRSMISTRSIETQHRLLGLLATLLGVSMDEKDERFGITDVPENAEQLLNPDSISQLCQFVAWGHTNDVQVGNVLSRALGVDVLDTKMLTDGRTMNAQGIGGETTASTTKAAGDWMCPSIWFVTSSGRVPPPPETIRGPFRISDLKKLMNSGDLSPYDFVTTSRVDEYDADGEHTSGGELDKHIDTGKWKRLNQVWQLRWQLCTDGNSSTIYSPSDVAILALKALLRLVELHRSLDLRGVPYFPIPTAKRILCSTSRDRHFISDSDDTISCPLPIICQSLLCNDNRIIDQASTLIYKLCEHNERAVSKLYLTGIFFFALSYTGSDFKILSKLIHATHLRQHFKSGYAAAASESEIPMRERSIIGNLIPEGILFLLTNYGFERFAEVFVSNADTPEAIWTYDMRKHLIEMIKQHLGDFPLRLFQNNTTEYEYCPMPGVAYKRLEKEIFCHNYYLQNLCDEVRFPDWPICEPVEVFRSCLEHLKKQVNRDESLEEESLEKARRTLELKTGDGSKELRKSYRTLARQFHPDKNPAGRDMFEAIQTSYELLLPLVERGETIRAFVDESTIALMDQTTSESSTNIFPSGQTQLQTMSLLIQTQAIICRRYEKDMSRLKYPAYPILMLCISQPKFISLVESEFAKADRAAFVLLVVELIFRTCLISPLNSEELVTANGVPRLVELLDFYIDLIKTIASTKTDKKIVTEDTICGILGFVVRTLAGVAFYQTGREAIKALDESSKFLVNWRRCISEQIFDGHDRVELSIRRYALEGVANMAQDPTLQEGLIGCGVVWPMIRYTMMYDATVEESTTDNSDVDDIGFSMSSINQNARLSIRALGILSGLYGDGPRHTGLCDLMNVLLTYPIAKMLRNQRTDSMLKVLNSNVERPDIIWNVEMRKELEAYVLHQEKHRPELICRSSIEELSSAKLFSYDLLKKELKIGDVYVRQFNRGGKEALVFVENPKNFLESILNAIAQTVNHAPPIANWVDIDICQSSTVVEGQASVILPDNDFLAAMNTLRILCLTDGLLDDIIVSSPSRISTVLFCLLDLPQSSQAFDIGCDTLLTVCSRHIFADEVTRERTLWRLMNVLERPDNRDDTGAVAVDNYNDATERTTRGWAVLEGLSSSPSIVNYILTSSGWVELLGVLVGYSNFTKSWSARTGAAKTLSRLLWDPSLGTFADSLMKQVLPTTLISRLKEDPEDMLKQFDANVDTPELIWDASMRNELRQVLGCHIDLIIKRRTEGVSDNNPVDHNLFVKYSRLDDEVYLGGVYVARFVKEPTYSVRDPTSFLEQLLQRWAKEVEVYTTDQQTELSTSGDTAVVTSTGPDILELVTTAIVYICKVRDSLCDKLAGWGYMARSVTFLDELLCRNKIGTPLLAVIRLLHVCAGRLSNIEALALIGHSDGRQGVVEFIIKAIGKDTLHPDSAFMIEFLKKAYGTALGDLDKAHEYTQTNIGPHFIAMAPSPASGDGPVRKRVTIGDDPLGMMQFEQQDQQHMATPQTGGVATHTAVSEPMPMSRGHVNSNVSASLAGTVDQYQGYPSQSFTNHQQTQFSPANPSSAQTIYDPRHTMISQTNNMVHHSIPSQATYSQPTSFLQPHQNAFHQNYTPPHSQFGTPPANQSVTQQQQYNQQLQPHQTIGPMLAHHKRQPSERPHGTTNIQQQQEPVQVQHPSTQQYHQSLNPKMVQNIPYYQQPQPHQQPQQQQPNSYSSQQQQYMQSPLTTSSQPTQPHLPVQQYNMSTTYHQPQQTLQARIPIYVHQAPTQHALHVSAPSVTIGNQLPPQDAVQHQTQLRSHSHSYASGFNTHGIQHPQNSYMSPSTAAHDGGIVAGSTTAAQDNIGLPQGNEMGTPHLEANFMTSQPPSYKPTPSLEGKGIIDARSGLDPTQIAEHQKVNVAGAPNSAHGRISWLRQAIATNLCSFLINDVLENSSLKQIRDPDSAKVHAIAVIKLLLKDPGYGAQFQLTLKEIPAWKKYKSQDHSLLITGHEQRADYFLTDGGSGVNKLLTDR